MDAESEERQTKMDIDDGKSLHFTRVDKHIKYINNLNRINQICTQGMISFMSR